MQETATEYWIYIYIDICIHGLMQEIAAEYYIYIYRYTNRYILEKTCVVECVLKVVP